MEFIAIIPARYASTRFPGKPLADMNGKPMIQRVYEQVKKCVDNQALYFSRSIVPYVRGCDIQEWMKENTFYKHIGMYAYRAETLAEITLLPQSSLEKAESLEQLRWLQNGYKIKVGITTQETIGIDTPDDMQKALQFMNEINNK